jgi:hypothetical protein
MRARLGAYGLWQLRDFVFERAAAIAVVFAVYIWAIYEQTAVARGSVFVRGGSHALEFGASLLAGLITYTAVLAALIAVYGMISNDRTTGRFRLVFAKPVRVLPYYAQAFALHGLAYMLLVALGVAAFTRLFPVSGSTVGGGLVLLAVTYLLVGGVCFLFSAIWRFDWISTGVMLGVVTYAASNSPGARWLYPLPPFWMIFEQITVLEKMRPLEPRPLLWAAAYGVACFLLGLIILKRRPLAT